MKPIWEEGFWPPEVWTTLGNLAIFGAIVGVISALLYLWHRGPGIFIKYGPAWMTKLGLHWTDKREQKEENNGTKDS